MSDSIDRPAHTNSEKYKIAAENPLALARILGKVVYQGDCWIWTGAKNNRGYAVARSNKQDVYVHRLTHWIVRGPVEDGIVMDHLCRHPACVNPMHTEAVTSRENTRRGNGNGRQTHCPSGHPYDETNTRIWVNRQGYARRYCIACMNERNAARATKKS